MKNELVQSIEAPGSFTFSPHLTCASCHESAHLVKYLDLYGRTFPQLAINNVEAISIQPERKGQTGYVRIRNNWTPEKVREALGVCPAKSKLQFIRDNVQKEIRFLLAGFAAELIYMGYAKDRQLITDRFVRFNGDVRVLDSDFQKAVELNSAVGNQNITQGLAPLKRVFIKTIKEIMEHGKLVEFVATQLDAEKTIRGTKLSRLNFNIINAINNKK